MISSPYLRVCVNLHSEPNISQGDKSRTPIIVVFMPKIAMAKKYQGNIWGKLDNNWRAGSVIP
jgi:hypothetical protein